jgi:AAA domain, putative AbiEii toxin, Type IV TA system
MQRAFGWHVFLNGWGSQISLHVSDKPQNHFENTTSTGFATPETIAKIGALRLLSEQSDGVRSYASILLDLMSSSYPLMFIDEPEVFLHPPQAAMLGEELRRLRGPGSQLFISTHDLNFVLGLLRGDPDNGRVMFVRLTRSGDFVKPHVVLPEEVLKIWADPMLRFSRTLDGLFHDGVVVVEGDIDCRFYSLVKEQIDRDEQNDDATERPSVKQTIDIMFTQSGGKQRTPTVVRALRNAGVRTLAITDFDVLNDELVLRNILQSLGANDEVIAESESLRKIVDANVRGSDRIRTKQSFVDAVAKSLDLLRPDDQLTRETETELKSILKQTTGWANAKKNGLSAVPSGEGTVAANQLLALLASEGLFVVPVGFVESFVREIGKGKSWLPSVIESNAIARATTAIEFIKKVLAGMMPAHSTLN